MTCILILNGTITIFDILIRYKCHETLTKFLKTEIDHTKNQSYIAYNITETNTIQLHDINERTRHNEKHKSNYELLKRVPKFKDQSKTIYVSNAIQLFS